MRSIARSGGSRTVPVNGVPIGQGTEDWLDLPIDANYGYNYSQTIYLQSEINIANKRISKIYYYWTGLEAAESSKDWVIYMGHTTNTGFNTGNDWIPVSQMLEVFNGEVILPDVAGWVEIILDNPFNYNNTQNLVIAVDENTPDFDDGDFYGTETTENRSLAYSDDFNDFDPEFPYEGQHCNRISQYPASARKPSGRSGIYGHSNFKKLWILSGANRF